jgi:predicted amidohydrolase
MIVTLLQTDIQWSDPEENIRRAELLISSQLRADLYVLPEMWATGFATKPMDVAEEEQNAVSLRWMRETAKRLDCALSGSLAVRTEDGLFRNRHYFVSPDKTYYYDKHHLFTYGHEDRYFTSGQEHTVVNFRGVNILLLTCYDLRFPLWSRYGLAGTYDMIVCVANWPDSRQLPWRYLTRARAIENQCYLVGVNRVGSDDFCNYQGESLVCDSSGETLVVCGNQQEAKTVTLDFEALAKTRGRFKVLEDRDLL